MSPQTTAKAAVADTKKRQKAALQKKVQWPSEAKAPLICLPNGMTDELGGQLLRETLEGILTLPVQLVIVGKGSSEYGKILSEFAESFPHRLAIIQDTATMREMMMDAADMALFFADPSAEEVEACLAHGTVPIAPKCTHIDNYNPVQETGEGFLYEELSPWHCFAAVVRAHETYRFPYDWKTIVKHGAHKVAK